MANSVRLPLTVDRVTPVGTGVYQVDLAIAPHLNRFLPGQFMHLSMEEFDPSLGFWPESRVFSIASAPRTATLQIVYSVKGRYTKKMEAELRPGRQVWVKFPYGDFVVSRLRDPSRPAIFLAGGTGVAPFIPFLDDPSTNLHNVHVFYGVRYPDHLLYRETWERLFNQGRAQVHLFCEEGVIDGLVHSRGRFGIAELTQAAGGSVVTGQYFLSGPPSMIAAMKKSLNEAGVAANDIFSDDWE